MRNILNMIVNNYHGYSISSLSISSLDLYDLSSLPILFLVKSPLEITPSCRANAHNKHTPLPIKSKKTQKKPHDSFILLAAAPTQQITDMNHQWRHFNPVTPHRHVAGTEHRAIFSSAAAYLSPMVPEHRRSQMSIISELMS